jgi:hypothetical protein
VVAQAATVATAVDPVAAFSLASVLQHSTYWAQLLFLQPTVQAEQVVAQELLESAREQQRLVTAEKHATTNSVEINQHV